MPLRIEDSTKLTQILANHAVNTKYEDIPKEMLLIQRRSFIDMLGVMIAATKLDVSGPLFANYAANWGNGKCSILGREEKTTPVLAALANGSLTHALDYEDTHDFAPVHPNSTSFPAAIALSQQLGNISGKEFLAAMVVAGDICCRLDLTSNEDLLKHGWYSPPIHGAIAAAVAAGRLLHLNEKQMMDAVSMAACQFTCIAECANSKASAIRTVREGFASQAGVQAALLAKEGVPAAIETLLEGKLGYYHAYTHDNFTPSRFVDGIGTKFENIKVGFKPWPACRVGHPSLDAVLGLVKEHDIKPEEVISIDITLHESGRMLFEPKEAKLRPTSPSMAKLSLPFVVGTAIVYREVGLGSFTDERLNDKAVLSIADKLNVSINKEWTKIDSRKSIVSIKTTRGEFTASRDTCLGCTDNPMSDDDIYRKFIDCGLNGSKKYSVETLNIIYEKAMKMDEISNMTEILDLI